MFHFIGCIFLLRFFFTVRLNTEFRTGPSSAIPTIFVTALHSTRLISFEALPTTVLQCCGQLPEQCSCPSAMFKVQFFIRVSNASIMIHLQPICIHYCEMNCYIALCFSLPLSSIVSFVKKDNMLIIGKIRVE